MSDNTPYPGYPPSYQHVRIIGGLTRTCLVVELKSEEPLSDGQMAMIREQLEGTLDRVTRNISILQKAELVSEKRFDTALLQGLRLAKK